ncbi:pyridoxal phosphate-dependent transferase [Corynascus similis CBS 632.67]
MPESTKSQKSQNELGCSLDIVLNLLLNRRLSRNQLRRLTTVRYGMVDFSSNAYLSLSSQSAVQQAFLTRLQAAASTPDNAGPALLGSGGSRLLDGNSSYAESLEHTIAAFHGAQAGLLFNSAMDANVGLFSCVPQPGDVIVYDELIHASVHDGMRMSRAVQKVPFRHNQVWDVPGARSVNKSLEEVLGSLVHGADGHLFRSGDRHVFIAVEGIYSMDGDVAPLAGIVNCVERYLPRRNGYIVVDEAHSIGILGKRGRGLVCELGLEQRVWARVLGFGKALGCTGGIVLCSPITRAYLINYARTLIYTTAMAFPTLASIETVYGFLTTGQAEPLLHNLRLLIREAHKGFKELCIRENAPAELLRVSNEKPESPIIPIFTSQPRSLAGYCQARGFMVRPIVAPTVPKGRERIRVCIHAANSMPEIRGLVETVAAWLAAWRTADSTKAMILQPRSEADGQVSSASKKEVVDKAKL